MSKHTKGALISIEVGVTDIGLNGLPVCELVTKDHHVRVAEYLSAADAARLALCWNTHDQLLEALEMAVRQNEHDMLMTGEELRQCYAAIKAAKGEA